MPTNSSYDQHILKTRQQLNLLREAFRPTPVKPGVGLLREDVQNLNNTARTELQQAMATAMESSLEITDTKEEGGVHQVQGVLHLGQDVRFSFTSQQPDGCYISAENLELSERTSEILGKLQAYYATWYTQASGGQGATPAAPGAASPAQALPAV